jgi:NADH-quinone oxidoreductase subunit E
MQEVAAILARHPEAGRDHLIPILQEVQESQGFLSRDAVIEVSRHLGLPTSKVYGVATFYNQFRFQPLGRFHIQICRGTACHVKGSFSVLESLKRTLGITPGQTSRDGMFSLEVVACLGACGLAPLVCINGEFHGCVTSDSLNRLVAGLRRQVEAEKREPSHA